jgi:hypothetical protein
MISSAWLTIQKWKAVSSMSKLPTMMPVIFRIFLVIGFAVKVRKD